MTSKSGDNSNNQEDKSMIGDNTTNNLNGTTYYLDQNFENLKTEIKFDKRMNIQFSNDFHNQEYEKFFNVYYDNFKEKKHDQTYDKQLQEIKQNIQISALI